MKIIKLSVVLLAVASLSACSDSPSEVVENFQEDICDDGMEAFIDYAPPSQQEQMVKMLEENPKKVAAVNKSLDVKCSEMPEVKSEEIMGDSNNRAKVRFSDGSSISLEKFDGEWKIPRM